MNKNIKSRILQIVYGEIVAVVATVLVAYAFFGSSTATIIRSVAIVGIIFLGVYIVWIKTHKSYEKFYKGGLGENE